MVQKSAHPAIRLFDYLNGALDRKTARSIEEHLSGCDDCASLARLVGALKASSLEPGRERHSQVSNLQSQLYGEHPDIGELASFFYVNARRAEDSRVAAHVALCGSCREAIAQYARAEHAAGEYKDVREAAGEVPARAWEMIRDWEDSGFARPKPAGEVLNQDLLSRLALTLNEQTKAAREMETERSRPHKFPPTGGARISVFVVNSSGDVRSVEAFEQIVDPSGATLLRHAEGSQRFDNKPMYALFDLGENEASVVSSLIRRDTILMEHSRADDESRRPNYIIIED